MELKVGTVLEGKVTGIMKFGAFVSLPNGKSGLVHISEISNSYVNDVKDFLTEGQAVRVKIIGIDEAGRINLSIKKADPAASDPVSVERRHPAAAPASSFEDKLRAFMQDSESKMSSMKYAPEKKGGIPRRLRTKQ
jgi:S1 RNA binding domain protein